MSKSDDELDRLLKRGKLSRPEKERILENVLGGLDETPEKSPIFAPWLRFAVAALAMAAVIIPIARMSMKSDDGFRPKSGGNTAVSAAAACKQACRPGETLAFELSSREERLYFAAFVMTPDKKRIWYFPSQGQPMPAVKTSTASGVLDLGIALGPEHVKGTHELHFVFAKTPLDKDALKAALDSHSDVIVHHGTQPLEIGE